MEIVFIQMTELKSRQNPTVNFQIIFSLNIHKLIFAHIIGLLRLTINNCTQADVGKYTCRIYNTHGEDVCNAELVFDSEYLMSAILEFKKK